MEKYKYFYLAQFFFAFYLTATELITGQLHAKFAKPRHVCSAYLVGPVHLRVCRDHRGGLLVQRRHEVGQP